MDAWLHDKISTVEALAKRKVFLGSDLQAKVEAVRVAAEHMPQAETVAWDAVDGTSYTDAGKVNNLAERDYFQAALKGQTAVSSLVLSKSTGNKVFVVEVPIKEGDKVVSLVHAAFNFQALGDLVSKNKVGNTGYSFLIDKAGVFMYHPTEDRILAESILQSSSPEEAQLGSRMLAEESGLGEYKVGKVQQLGAFTRLATTGWVVVATEPTAEVYAGINRLTTTAIILILLAGVIAAGIGLAIARSIANPLVSLAQSADVAAGGDLTVDVPRGFFGELGTLAGSFRRMLENTAQVVQQVVQVSDQVAASSEELSASAQQVGQVTGQVAEAVSQLAKGADDGAKAAQTTSTVVDAMAASIQQVSASSQNMAITANETAKTAEEGRKAVDHAIHQMETIEGATDAAAVAVKGLGERSKQIGHTGGPVQTVTRKRHRSTRKPPSEMQMRDGCRSGTLAGPRRLCRPTTRGYRSPTTTDSNFAHDNFSRPTFASSEADFESPSA
jgi:methyl-accepting chemotaxis protein